MYYVPSHTNVCTLEFFDRISRFRQLRDSDIMYRYITFSYRSLAHAVALPSERQTLRHRHHRLYQNGYACHNAFSLDMADSALF